MITDEQQEIVNRWTAQPTVALVDVLHSPDSDYMGVTCHLWGHDNELLAIGTIGGTRGTRPSIPWRLRGVTPYERDTLKPLKDA